MISDINLLPPITKKSNRSLVVGWLIGLLTMLILALFVEQMDVTEEVPVSTVTRETLPAELKKWSH